MSEESIGPDLLDPEKNPFDLDELHSLTTGLFIGLGIGFLGGWLAAFYHLNKESHYAALGFFIGIFTGLPLGALISKLLFPFLSF